MPNYLAIPGIPGDSTADRHEQEIEVESWSFGCTQPAAGHAGSGARVARPDFTDLVVSCRGSSASPLLLEACATSRVIDEAVLTRQSEAGRGDPATEVRLNGVRVRGYTVIGSGDDLRDEVRFGFARVTFTMRGQLPDGRPGEAVSTTQPSIQPPVPTPGSGGVWRAREPVPDG